MKALPAIVAVLCSVFTVSAAAAQNPMLGPKDGAGLEPVDTGRVGVGDMAPDFTLASLKGERVTLSDFRGRKNILLVFYRGYW